MQKMGRTYEIILIDDGSEDNSLSLLKSFTVYPEVRVVELVRNYGQHAIQALMVQEGQTVLSRHLITALNSAQRKILIQAKVLL
jgi:phosphatidylserine/phosphatidylglycerophosphate/cardiolipin synthase-like enzyme